MTRNTGGRVGEVSGLVGTMVSGKLMCVPATR